MKQKRSPDAPLTAADVRFLHLLHRLIVELGRGPTVTEFEEHWSGSRSGIIERAHALRSQGMLTWPTSRPGKAHSWAKIKLTDAFFKKYGRDEDE